MNFREFYENTNLKANELKKGDKVKNINPDCEHYKSTGIVKSVKSLPAKKTSKVKSGENIPGNIITYKVTNKGKNFNTGDEITKTEIQLSKIK